MSAATVEELSGAPGANVLSKNGTDCSGNGSVNSDIEFAPRAYAKMLLHSAKYPHRSVNGLLLANKSERGKCLVVTDCIPLFHHSEGLTPMIEVALAQIESRCERANVVMAGFYHATKSLKDSTSVDVFSQRTADKLAENANPKRSVALVTVDNKRVGMVLDSHALLVQMWQRSSSGGQEGSAVEGSGRWRHIAAKSIGVDENTLAVTSEMLQRKLQKDLNDFDNHLDDLTQDYLNVSINMEVDRFYQ